MIPQSLGEWLLTANLFGSLAIGLVVAAIPLVRRFCGSRAAFLLWAIVLIRLLAPVFPTAPFVSVRQAVVPGARVSVWVSETRTDSPRAEAAEDAPAASLVPKKTAGNPWLAVWLAGTGLAMAPAIFGIFRGLQIRRRGADVTAAVRDAVPELPPRLRVLASEEIPGPALCGLFAPAILLPAACLENLSAEQLRCVIQHEIGHFRRGDMWWRWAFLLARSLHWFNPLVWWAERRAWIDQEMACDEWALARDRVDRRAYGEALLAVTRMLGAGRRAPMQVAMAETAHGLERRLGHVASGRRRGRFARALALAMVACAVLALGPVRVAAESTLSTRFVPANANEPAAGGNFVEIESRLVELPPAVVEEVLGREGERAMSILSPERYEELLRRITDRKGVDLLTAPRVSAKSGQRAAIQMVREFRYPTEFEIQESGGKNPVAPGRFETRNVGVELEVESVVGPNRRIDLTLCPRVTEFLGFVNYGADHPARKDGEDPLKAALTAPAGADHAINQPIFGVRSTMTNLVLKSGDTVVLGGLRGNGSSFEDVIQGQPSGREGTDRLLFVFVTATVLDREGKPQPAAPTQQKAAPSKGPVSGKPVEGKDEGKDRAQAGDGAPYAIPVEGKPGFVTSPYAPDAGYVDLRGFPKDTEVKDPYSGKIMRVPYMEQPSTIVPAARQAAEKSRIDFVIEEASVKEALDFIGARTHLQVESAGVEDDGRKFTFKISDVSAADAFSQIAEAAGLRVTYSDDAVHVVSKNAGQGAAGSP